MMDTDTLTAEVQALASEALGYRVAKVRDDGVRFESFADDAPDWTRELARYAHEGGEIWPDDWRYACMFAACEAIADADEDAEPGDVGHEFADGYVDTYTSDRLAWLASSLRRTGYV